MQELKNNEMYEDSLIHIPNILRLLENRGIIQASDFPKITTQLDQQKHTGYMTFEIISTENNKDFYDLVDYHHKHMQKYSNITQGFNYRPQKILVMYVFPILNKTINVAFKRVLDSNVHDTVIVFCDEKCVKTLKKIIIKEDILRKQQSKPQSKTTRFDIIHFDTVLCNLLENYHSASYKMISQSKLNSCQLLNNCPMFQHKIYPNDPVLLYYGFIPFTIIEETFPSDITGGISSQYLLVKPVDPDQETENYSSFTFFLS